MLGFPFVGHIIIGEYSENEFRKQFTASERVAIARAVEEELGNRQGQRTDNYPEVPRGESRNIAARRAGFGSDFQYRQAAKVTEIGSPELIAAMDTGEVSIAAAEVIANQQRKGDGFRLELT